MQPIQLKFTHTEAEYLAATRLLLFGQKVLLIRTAAFLTLVVAGILMLSLLGDFAFPLWASLLLGVVMAGGFAYMGLVDAPRRFFRKDPKMRDEFLLTFSEEGVAVKTAQIDSKLAWSLYKGVQENKSVYVLVYNDPARMSMTLVPKRAFRNPSEELEFRRLVQREVDQSLALTNESLGDHAYAYVPSKSGPPDWR